jgi:macrodomain Ter protein organizer (MatP/YcbG family)
VSEKKTKTVGLDLDVWRALKQISLDRDATLSETVDFLMEQLKQKEKADEKGSTGNKDKKYD